MTIPAEWTTTVTNGGETYPFVEDENANITGYGHQEPSEFAAAVNRYDTECNGEPFAPEDQWNGEAISHQWVTLDPDSEQLHPSSCDVPGAFAVTTLWGQR